MHRIGEVDGNDFEFVFATSNTRCAEFYFISNRLGDHILWVQDFDPYRVMTKDTIGLEQAVTTFWRNDPYYPRPMKIRHYGVLLETIISRVATATKISVSLQTLIEGVISQSFLTRSWKDKSLKEEERRLHNILALEFQKSIHPPIPYLFGVFTTGSRLNITTIPVFADVMRMVFDTSLYNGPLSSNAISLAQDLIVILRSHSSLVTFCHFGLLLQTRRWKPI